MPIKTLAIVFQLDKLDPPIPEATAIFLPKCPVAQRYSYLKDYNALVNHAPISTCL